MGTKKKKFSLHPTAQIGKSVSFNDSNRPTMTDNQSAWLGINSSELLPRKSTEDRATGGRILVQRHCHLQCSIELIDAPSIGDNYVSNRPLAMTSTNSLKKNGANSTAVQFRRGGTPSFLFSPSKGTDARVSTSPSLYVQNVILSEENLPSSRVVDARSMNAPKLTS